MENPNEIYEEYGFKNREEYLNNLATECNVPFETVYALADILGKSEDFDALISILEDYSDIPIY